MFQFNADKWTPKYILNDKSGYALAKAIEAAVNYLNNHVLAGVRCATDYDYMPEWRLDELAREINCLFDYNASIEVKRRWIKSAYPMYRLYGTPAAIYQYIGSYFDDVDVEEWWEYGAEPYHFRLTVDGEWTPKNEAWAHKALSVAKNARSVLDGLRPGGKSFLALAADGKVRGQFHYPMTGAENWAGRWPNETTLGITDRSGAAALTAKAYPYYILYTMTGTKPDYITLDHIGENDIQAAQADDTYTPISYKMCGEDDI